ncbi:SDR family oxidoreductase [Heyndrickxia ginsengihumi]|uniref:SDR family oxidoreductase n=1 Tax=Heyndrickxia ginsengihumi TaxID=363870 RepID=A0A0A6VGL7_9BACI|nr:SDR family oxidoreductase [Heyndrickxia ginsengihumi]KHD86588.1 sugar epimerase [Heyndrickxia ginsengihumi]MBE6183072.1 SDR family oxidoreductase [Bacillus sp. (in: firmicutes)]MCM3022621.1 SDR family oxidoreductase [Heyndrickxia ginsengihumi]NEY19044.1 SDR family oxidoreductase [Heyndrickxia ginsengihumi]
MKVLVIGANGQIGKKIVGLLRASNQHQARAMVRTKEQVELFRHLGVETVYANLEGTVNEIAEAANGCDALVFTAGSGGKTGADKTLLVDLDGAVKAIEAAEKVGIQRFILVSALQAHHRENWNEAIKPYYVAKHYADRILEASALNYTIIRPGGLTNEQGTGRVSAAENLKRGTIPREDVAEVIIASLTEEKTYKRAFDIISGDTPIKEALSLL